MIDFYYKIVHYGPIYFSIYHFTILSKKNQKRYHQIQKDQPQQLHRAQ